MVHSLCYTFARCTKSVSLVPVCYIAGKLILLFSAWNNKADD
jgi:hypothetical protein